MNDSGFSEIHDIVHVTIDTKINSAAYIYTGGAETGHTRNVCDLEFQGQLSKSRDFVQHFLYP